MTIEELYKLAEQGYITDTSLIAACEKNNELLSSIDFGQFVNQITSPIDVKEVEDMLWEMIENTNNAKLSSNTNISKALVIEGKEFELDLNGKTLSAKESVYVKGEVSALVCAKKGSIVTIKGNGKIDATKSDDYAIEVRGGKVIIEDGVFHGAVTAVYALEGNVVIKGGEFHATPYNDDYRYLLNIYDKAPKGTSIQVEGGVFYGFDPADNLAENPKVSFLAQGFESYVIEEDVFGVRKIEETPIVDQEPTIEPTDSPVVVEEKEDNT